MTRKDYVAIASVLSKWRGRSISKDLLITELSDTFKRNNPDFDRDKFYAACYKKE